MAPTARARPSVSMRRTRSAHSMRSLPSCSPTSLRCGISLGHDAAWDARITAALNAVRAQTRTGKRAPAAIRDVRVALDEMRLVKDDHEIALMRQAAAIAGAAHRRAMRFAAPGKFEYEVEAEFLHEFRRRGSQFPAYSPIVAGGANACVLHYVGNNQRAARRRPAADRRRLRTRRLRQRHHPHLSRQWPLLADRRPTSTTSCSRPDGRHRRHPARRHLPRAARRPRCACWRRA